MIIRRGSTFTEPKQCLIELNAVRPCWTYEATLWNVIGLHNDACSLWCRNTHSQHHACA